MKNLLKRTLLVVLASALILPIQSFAASDQDDCRLFSKEVITDKDRIQEISIQDKIETPKGYRIESIVIDSYRFLDKDCDLSMQQKIAIEKPCPERSFFNGLKIMNINKSSLDYYFPKSPLSSDWIDGPSKFTQSFEESVTASFNSDVSVSASVVEAGLGFSVTKSTKYTKSYQVSVPKGKKMNLKVFGNYERYTFDVYKKNEKIGSGKAYKPIGLTFKQYIYTK